MSERFGRKAVEARFAYFIKAIGGRTARSSTDVGGYVLDYSPYGGYVIVKISSSGGGQSMPFGLARRSAREMIAAMRFAEDTLEARKRRSRAAGNRRRFTRG